MPEQTALDDLLAGMVEQQRLFNERLTALELHETPPASAFAAAPVMGVWTPSFAGSTIAGTFTYNVRAGYYTLIGNVVNIWADVRISAIGTPPTGNMWITGLPFAVASEVHGSLSIGLLSQLDIDSATYKFWTAFARVSTTRIELFENPDNGVAINFPAARFTNAAAALLLSGTYRK